MNITEIIRKKLEGEVSTEEDRLLEAWISESSTNRRLFYRLKSLNQRGVPMPEMSELDTEIAWKKTMAKIEVRRKPFGFITILKYAAIFIGVVGIISYGFWGDSWLSKDSDQLDKQAIILQFDNGEHRVISNEDEQSIENTEGETLGTVEIGQIDYSKTTITAQGEYHSLKIPYGKNFKVVLSDGSIVHLNAGSSLRYPVKFSKGEERHVFLSGEAFFDVSKATLNPFIVTSGKMAIKVLGTHFNVTSYPDDLNIKTVLVEGSVRLYERVNGYDLDSSILLAPGELATFDNEIFVVDKVDTKIYTAWMNGKLVFKKLPFRDIAKKLERRYNVNINNEYKELEERVFTATFDVETIDEVLVTFAAETHFEYEIVGNEITLKQPVSS
ncbi:MAG: DUF4974 domain-containing protein [Pricia sp.]|nr:DUF4974 domain-containing protein [Pricia sp.]